MKKAHDMNDAEIIAALKAEDIRAKLRFAFSDWSGRIDQASRQLKLSSIEFRRMELEAAEAFMQIIRIEK